MDFSWLSLDIKNRFVSSDKQLQRSQNQKLYSNVDGEEEQKRAADYLRTTVIPGDEDDESKYEQKYFEEDEYEYVDEEVDEDEDESEGEGRGKGFQTDAWDGYISVTLTDPNMLDCCLCFQSLASPVFHCENGHMVCSDCWARRQEKCPMCWLPTRHNPCGAIEKLLGCINAEYDCKEKLSYLEMNDYEKNYLYVPCFCPFSGCGLFASSEELSLHVNHKHGDRIKSFRYNHTFFVFLRSTSETIIFQELDDGELFVLKSNAVIPLGNVVDISSIGPNSSMKHHYDILATSQGCDLKLESFAKNVQHRYLDAPPSSGFILIPRDYSSGSEELLTVEIIIRH